MSNRTPDFGPLPKVDRNDELQRRSMTALGAVTPHERFLFRDDREEDKGVDGSFELLNSGDATNIRAQFQLKATDRADLNADGSFSLPIETSNLNYLLNGSSPLYVLWRAGQNEFRYAWARDVARRLQEDNPDWRDQGTVTIRFDRPLTPSAWDDVYDRTLREGRAQRETHDAITRAATTEPLVIGINPPSMAVTTPADAYELVSRNGTALVAAGHASAVEQAARLLPQHQADEPEVQLTLGYGAFYLGHYFEARGHLARAQIGRERLGDFSGYLLDSLLAECDHLTGRIGGEEYAAAQRRVEETAPPFLALQLRLDRVRLQHLRERDNARRDALLAEIRELVDRIEADPGAYDALKLQARLVRLYANIGDTGVAHLEAVGRMMMRRGMGQNPLTNSTAAAWQQARSDNAADVQEENRILAEAARLNHPLLMADALLVRGVRVLGAIIDRLFATLVLGQAAESIPDEVFTSVRQSLEHAIGLYEGARHTEGKVRATLLLAQWLEVIGRRDEAIATAQQVLGVARAMGYERHADMADELIAGTSHYRRVLNAATNPPDLDVEMSRMSDDDVRRYARNSLEAMELPGDRLPVIERMCFTLRGAAREMVSWCGSIGLLEEPQARADRYVTDPYWVGHCSRHGHQSLIQARAGDAILSAFRQRFCADCPDRRPRPA